MLDMILVAYGFLRASNCKPPRNADFFVVSWLPKRNSTLLNLQRFMLRLLFLRSIDGKPASAFNAYLSGILHCIAILTHTPKQ